MRPSYSRGKMYEMATRGGWDTCPFLYRILGNVASMPQKCLSQLWDEGRLSRSLGCVSRDGIDSLDDPFWEDAIVGRLPLCHR